MFHIFNYLNFREHVSNHIIFIKKKSKLYWGRPWLLHKCYNIIFAYYKMCIAYTCVYIYFDLLTYTLKIDLFFIHSFQWLIMTTTKIHWLNFQHLVCIIFVYSVIHEFISLIKVYDLLNSSTIKKNYLQLYFPYKFCIPIK